MPSDAIFGSLGPQKPTNSIGFFNVFAHAGFHFFFEGLDVILGPVFAAIGLFWSQNGSNNGSKVVNQLVNPIFCLAFDDVLGPFWGPYLS